MMRGIRAILISIIILINSIALSGCWNYREIDKMSIVTGLAIDKGTDDKYLLTIEFVEIKGAMEHKIIAKTITMTGDTIFDTIRNFISLSGKRLYWAHTKILIISQDIARDDVVKILDFFNRDSETRADINILVSKEKTAKEIFESKGTTNEVISFELDDMLKNENSLSKALRIEIADFIIDLAGKGIASIAPAIGLQKTDNQISPQVMGTAIFTKNKLITFLNGDETKQLIFVRNMIKGGLLVQNENDKEGSTKITLEIFKNKTDIKPILKDGNVEININIETTVAIDEIEGIENYLEEDRRMKLERDTEENMNSQVENLIKKVQSEYDTDIFGFGAKIREDMPNVWRKIEPEWKNKFKDLKVNVNTKIHIKNSAMLSKPLPVGD